MLAARRSAAAARGAPSLAASLLVILHRQLHSSGPPLLRSGKDSANARRNNRNKNGSGDPSSSSSSPRPAYDLEKRFRDLDQLYPTPNTTALETEADAQAHTDADLDNAEQRRRDRITEKLLNAAKLGNPPVRAPSGSDPYAGWKPSPGSSSSRNLGRPKLSDEAKAKAEARLRRHAMDVNALLGGHTAGRLNQPLVTREDAGVGPDDADDALYLDHFLYPPRRIQAGDFVEIRTAGISAIGIVLPKPDDERDLPASASASQVEAHKKKKVLRLDGEIFVLLSTGVVTISRDTDVMIQVPRMVERGLTYRAAAATRSHVSSSNLDGPSTSDGAHDPHDASGSAGQSAPGEATPATEEPIDEPRFEARASICNKLRIIERQKVLEVQRLLPAFRSLFLDDDNVGGSTRSAHVPSDRMDLATGTITTYEATRLMQDRLARTGADGQARRDPITVATMLAAHTLLMDTPTHFLADTLSHRTSQLYTCRSPEERRTLRVLERWVKSAPGSEAQSHIDAFCAKARTVMAWSAAHPYRGDGPPRRIDAEGLDVQWSDEDRLILSFLEASLGSRRAIQDDTHGSIAMEILKRAGAHIRVRPHPAGRPDMELDEAADTLLFPASPTSSAELSPATTTASEAAATASPASELDAHAYEILRELGGVILAGPDLQHALVLRFLKDVGYLAPWHNPLRLDTTFRTLVSGEGDGQPEPHGSEETTAPVASASTTPSPSSAYQLGIDADVEAIRHDFGKDLPVYVIDDAGAFELDDGISIEPIAGSEDQAWVHVHIADPTASMRPDDALATRARRRFSTLYFPEARWALLPDDFVSAGVGLRAPTAESTRAGQGQRVMTFSAKIDARNGQVDDFHVRPAWVHNVNVVSYDRVNEMLRQSSASGDLVRLHRIARALAAARIRGTAINAWRRSASLSLSPLPLPDTMVSSARLDGPRFYTGSPDVSLSVLSVQEDPSVHASQFLVAELMLLAGRVAGAFGEQRDVPLPYRLQPRPEDPKDLERILAMRDPDTGGVDFEKMIIEDLTIPQGQYSDHSGEHFAMGICNRESLAVGADALSKGGYIRATSPLRRYPDMVAHWQLKSSLLGRPLAFSRTELRHRLGQFERSELLSKQLNRAASRAWILRAIEDALQRRREGRATEADARILGPHQAVLTLAHVRINSLTLGARLRVQVEGLGMTADMIWDAKKWSPKTGARFTVEVAATVQAGLRSALVVREVA
ncbi:uncharacterized protein PFL1_00710 [Pseudozyma flocculosa PF-1]|uniref:Related to Exoribonuclease II n=1 Tax=Pseudozyma flocculosa TaxID=84751 RepID=A0A5C3F4J0_9BASI|nr:uncharacterized protein PFL1_00710 [Pseudozyma flocculosa PF-1]EPQ31375.1 hypothetical protein PFL1_00710 [Pseudozyma flocculosa PF-1]SPO38845.1 related to Exoribonuclease II [Pseudozyma flocculosa]